MSIRVMLYAPLQPGVIVTRPLCQFLVVAALGFTALPASSQETTGQIRGRVRDVSGAPVGNARIVAMGRELLGTRTAVSAADGVYQLFSLPPGMYSVRVTAVGSRPVVIDSVSVQLGRTSSAPDATLERTAVALEELRISAARVTLDPARTSVGATIDQSELAALPGERDYKSSIAILSHANTSYHGDAVNIGGSTGLENSYFIDGVNVTAPWQNGSATNLPYNFIRAIEVRTGGYEARYGRALGGIVNAITFTGTNEFEANVFGYFTNSALAAQPRAEPTLKETGAYGADVGARVSGPILRDRLWFSAAYNPRIDHANRQVGTLGTYANETRAHLFAGKLTWQPREAATVELSVIGDPTTQQIVSTEAANGVLLGYTPVTIDPYLRRGERGGAATALKGSFMVGSGGMLEASVSRYDGRDREYGATEIGRTGFGYQDDVTRTIEGFSPYPMYITQSRTTASLHGTRVVGRHTLGAGLEQDIGLVNRSSGNTMILRFSSAFYGVDSQWVKGSFRGYAPATYVQDSWRIRDRLTVNVGVRLSQQIMKGASGATAQKFAKEWQPRAGFNWQLGTRAMARAFGSYGRFYQQLPLNIATIFFADSRATWTEYDTDPRQPGAVPTFAADFSLKESTLAGKANGLAPEHFDEFTLGYERITDRGTTVTLRGIQRSLRSAILIAFDLTKPPGEETFVGVPGRGDLSFLPVPTRTYRALEASVEGAINALHYRASYVLSRTRGNYTGLWSSDGFFGNPGTNFTMLSPAHAKNSTGLLANDRTHVIKASASRSFGRVFEAGGFATWQSGTPLSQFATGDFGFWTFVVPRGTAGRTPAVWDLNLRLSHDLRWLPNAVSNGRLHLDLLHIGNPRTTVRTVQRRYLAIDSTGTPVEPDSKYGQALLFQPPMSARLGFQVSY